MSVCKPSLLSAQFKHLDVCGGIDMHNSGITNVSSINGIVPTGFLTNNVNVIYKPGTLTVPGSNMYGLWSEVLAVASQTNVNQILNIFFDDTVVSPCPINQSYDFKGRTAFYSALSTSLPATARINDTIVISNLRGIYRTLSLVCDSITTNSLFFDNNAPLELREGSNIVNTATALVPTILVDNKNLSVVQYLGSFIASQGNPAVPMIRLINNATLALVNNFNLAPSVLMTDAISDDGTGTLSIISDASWDSYPTFASFTGTYNQQKVDNASLVNYDDTKLVAFGATNVQSALDSLKTSLTTGTVTTQSINVTNNSNQVVFGTGQTTTLDVKSPLSTITHSIPDTSFSCNVSLGINKFQFLFPPVTLLPEESGNNYRVNSVVPSTVTLPFATDGLKYTFVVTGTIAGSYVITCQSAILYGSLLSSNGVAVVGGNITTPQTLITLSPSAVIGDKYEFYSDGSYWYVYGVTADNTSVVVS